MFRSHLIQPREEEHLKYASNKGEHLLNGQQKGPISKFGINIRQNDATRPPNTITYVSPPSSPRQTRNHYEERTDNEVRESEPASEYRSMDNQRDDMVYSYNDIADRSMARLKRLDPAHPMVAGKSQASTQRTQALDLKNNDNAFHIVASLIVDRFEEELSDGKTTCIRVKAADMYHMERVVPDKKSFIEAVQYRVINCPEYSTKSIHEVTRRCQALGLDRRSKQNLLYAPIGSIFEIGETAQPTLIREVDTDDIDNARPNTLDELARQQIATELHEAENLVEESVTQEAKEFWQKQVDELQARLVALEAGHVAPAEEDLNYSKTEQGLLSTLWQALGYEPPKLEETEKENPNDEEDPEKGIELKSPTVGKKGSEDSSSSVKELPIVDVVAPADLPGGYKFEAELNGKHFMATVPLAGVQKGKTFYCYMEPTDDASILAGSWKDSPLDFFKYGYKHPMALCSILCPLLALAQVMERIKLDITGKRASSETPQLFLYTPRGMALSTLAVWAGLNIVILSGMELKAYEFLTISLADKLSLFLVNASLLTFTVYATINTRNYLMNRFQIPMGPVGSRIDELLERFIEDSPVGKHVETFLAGLFFPLSIAQMGRHTTSYEMYDGVFCNPTGIVEREQPL